MDNKHQFPASHLLAPANNIPLSPFLTPPNYGHRGNSTPSSMAAPKSGYYGSPAPLSSQPDAYYMQGGEAGQKSASYPCLFPQCEAQFPHVALLEQHMARHFGPNPENISAGGTLCGPSNLDSGDCHEALDATSGFTPSAGPSTPQMGNGLHCSTTQQESRVALDNDSISTGSAIPKKKFNCREPGCNQRFNRYPDLDRHEETHYLTGKVKLFECPEFGCNRKGEWGFSRRDKIVDHIRAKHKRSVGIDEFRKSSWSTHWPERKEWLESNGYNSPFAWWSRDISN